jgi:hypothetical protein
LPCSQCGAAGRKPAPRCRHRATPAPTTPRAGKTGPALRGNSAEAARSLSRREKPPIRPRRGYRATRWEWCVLLPTARVPGSRVAIISAPFGGAASQRRAVLRSSGVEAADDTRRRRRCGPWTVAQKSRQRSPEEAGTGSAARRQRRRSARAGGSDPGPHSNNLSAAGRGDAVVRSCLRQFEAGTVVYTGRQQRFRRRLFTPRPAHEMIKRASSAAAVLEAPELGPRDIVGGSVPERADRACSASRSS